MEEGKKKGSLTQTEKNNILIKVIKMRQFNFEMLFTLCDKQN